jgi:dihydropteroate synthase
VNARLLSAGAGLRVRDRLAQYLGEDRAAQVADANETAALALDDAPPAAEEVAYALRLAGAFAEVVDGRLLAVVAPERLRALATGLSAPATEVAVELARALEAARRPPGRVRLRDRVLDAGERPRIMAILNVTPDSFYDGGRYAGVDRARRRAAELVERGADLLDIGGQSYAHVNPRVAEAEERERVVPVVEALVRDGFELPLSIDTVRTGVAEAALDAGAHLINDCSGLADVGLAELVARYDAALVVMHLKGELNVRAAAYPYDDAAAEVSNVLRGRLEAARAAGVKDDALIVDPGLEFGKEPRTDLELLERFGDLRALGYPILFAASRKSFIGRIFNRPAAELLVPSLTVAALGIAAGAALVRVHDVAETLQLAQMAAAVRRANRESLPLAPAMPAG